MAQSDRRSTPKDADGATTDDATVSETGSLSQEPVGDSDAPDDGPHPTADLADADPRSSATAGTTDVDADADDDGEDAKPAAAKTTPAKAKATTTKAKTKTKAKATTSTSTATGAKDKDEAGGKASRSGDPARKSAAGEEKKPAKVSRTPVKPKRVANRWAAPMMLACAGIGLLWIVVFYVTQDRIDIPWYSDLGSWNLVVGMGFIVAAFGFSMKWQ